MEYDRGLVAVAVGFEPTEELPVVPCEFTNDVKAGDVWLRRHCHVPSEALLLGADTDTLAE